MHQAPINVKFASGNSTGGTNSPKATGLPVNNGAERLRANEAARRAAANPGKQQGCSQQDSEVDKAYNEIDHLLERLKQKTHLINRTLDQHNQMLPGINDEVSRNQER